MNTISTDRRGRRGRAGVGLAAATLVVTLGACGSSTSHGAQPVSRRPVGPYLNSDPTPHAPADEHWHAAIGLNVCGVWQPGPQWATISDQGQLARYGTNTYAGLHTHTLANGQSDGLIHMEPAAADEAGWNATVGRYLSYGGWSFSSTAMALWTGAGGAAVRLHAGDRCPSGRYRGQAVTLRWAKGNVLHAPALVEQHTDLNAYKLYDGDVIAIYALPASVALTGNLQHVPSAANLSQPNGGEGGQATATSSTVPSGPPACPNATAPARAATHTYKAPVDQHLDATRTYRAVVATTCGTFTITLDVQHAPKSANNFVFLARARFYDGLTFHRVVRDFVIQGGDPAGDGSGGSGYMVPTEKPRHPYTVGDVAWAKRGTDPDGSAGSQFFVITGAEGATLPLQYGIVGHVTNGLDVAKKIESLSTGDGPPRVPVYITTVTITG